MTPPIIVTGCHRSGTTIATHILADDLNRTPIDEIDFVMGHDYSNCVIQFPQGIDNYIILQHIYPGVNFLFVYRPKEDIIASMKRIKWLKDDVYSWDEFLDRYVESRYQLWAHVSSLIPEACDVIDYQKLSSHPFFVSKKLRKHFTSKQWQIDQPVGPQYWSNNIKCIQEMYCGQRFTSP